jgi:hypothetical protein
MIYSEPSSSPVTPSSYSISQSFSSLVTAISPVAGILSSPSSSYGYLSGSPASPGSLKMRELLDEKQLTNTTGKTIGVNKMHEYDLMDIGSVVFSSPSNKERCFSKSQKKNQFDQPSFATTSSQTAVLSPPPPVEDENSNVPIHETGGDTTAFESSSPQFQNQEYSSLPENCPDMNSPCSLRKANKKQSSHHSSKKHHFKKPIQNSYQCLIKEPEKLVDDE